MFALGHRISVDTILCYAQKPQSSRGWDFQSGCDAVVVRVTQLSDEVVMDKIHATDGAEFETSVSALKALKAAKVSDSVIRAMINAHTAVPPPSNGLVTSQKSELSKEIGVYVALNGVMTELQPEIVNWQTGGGIKTHATLGIVKGDVNGKIPGPCSGPATVPIDFDRQNAGRNLGDGISTAPSAHKR